MLTWPGGTFVVAVLVGLAGVPASCLFEALFVAALLIAVAAMVASMVWAVVAVVLRPSTLPRPAALFLSGAAVWAAWESCQWFLRLQEQWNEQRCTSVAQAIVRYQADNWWCPESLDALKPKYLTTVPTCWVGVWPSSLRYEKSEGAGYPSLWYKSHAGGTTSYSFHSERWVYSTPKVDEEIRWGP